MRGSEGCRVVLVGGSGEELAARIAATGLPWNRRVWRLRKARRLTQRQLAQRANLAMRTVFAAEVGQHEPRQVTKAKLLKALGVPWSARELVFPPELRKTCHVTHEAPR